MQTHTNTSPLTTTIATLIATLIATARRLLTRALTRALTRLDPATWLHETRRGVMTLALFVAIVAASFGASLVQDGARGPSSGAIIDAAPLAAAGLHYVRGYSVQGSWLCYGWSNGAYHCTQRWFRSTTGVPVSLHTQWVPNIGASARVSVRVRPLSAVFRARPGNWYPFGQCTWGAQALSAENLNGLGNARDWLWNAQRRGLPTGATPRIGATVTFQPGVQGASWLGHVGHVVAIGANGAFEMEAMNDNAGFGRFAFRWVHTGWGVGFIY